VVATQLRTVRAREAFKGPGPQVNGLEAVPEGLWVSDQRDNRTYLIDYNGKTLTSFASPARNASGTSFGAGSVWVSSNVRPSMIFRHDPQTGHCTAALHLPDADKGGVHGVQWRPYEGGVTPPPAPEARAELHPNAPAGKLNAGPGASGTLWVTRPGTKIIQLIDAETAELLRTIPFPAARSHGLFYDEADGTLSVVETNHGHVYKLDPKDGRVLDEWVIEGAEVHAMTRSADGRIWVGDASTNIISVVEL
jgi:streptogramin lyase